MVVVQHCRSSRLDVPIQDVPRADRQLVAWKELEVRQSAGSQDHDLGPVASVIRVKNYDEALSVANDTEFGLSAGIVTTSRNHAKHFQANSESGLIMVNLPTAGLDYHVPFGGRKASNYGPREQGRYATEFYTLVKTAYVS